MHAARLLPLLVARAGLILAGTVLALPALAGPSTLAPQAGALDPLEHTGLAGAPRGPRVLWYRRPAQAWIEALPLGNGRLGAMVFGGLDRERLQLNEDSLWPGSPDERFNKGTPEDLARFRQLLSDGQQETVEREIMTVFSAGYTPRSHQTLGDLWIDWRGSRARQVVAYRRSLDLDTALCETQYERGAARERREMFASAPAELLALRWESSATLDFDLSLTRPLDGERETILISTPAPGRLVMDGELSMHEALLENGLHGNHFRAIVAVETEGGTLEARADGQGLEVRDARSATIWISARCQFYGDDFAERAEHALESAIESGYETVRAVHLAAHRALMSRVAIELDGETGAGRAGEIRAGELPTDERLAAVRAGAEDPGLATLLFDYGRYLLISCSRPGTQPANLQGLWNEHRNAPWNADYHLNINLEMNYWLAEVANLAELAEPLFEFTERLSVRGALRARDTFGCRGWMAPHATDLWVPAYTRAVQPYWGFWHNGGAWLCQHLMEHWRFGRDESFLAERAWPLMAGAALFYLDWLLEDPDTGELVSGPSTSPENSFRTPDGQTGAVCMGPAMDQQIIASLFDDVLEAAAVLGVESAFVDELRAARGRLASGTQIAVDGRLLEWREPLEEPEPGHRHVSQLWALHPGDAIDPFETPELAAAARRTIDHRLSHGGAGTGWSRAWTIHFFARLHDGAEVHRHVTEFLRRSVAPNLFDLHPPFQIDGNFGFTSGLCEALLQSNHGALELLPALPAAWSSGSFRGLRARGAIVVDARWREGRLVEAQLLPARSTTLVLRAPGLEDLKLEGALSSRPSSPPGSGIVLQLDAGQAVRLSDS